MTELLLHLDFREYGNSADFIGEGWAEQEEYHRWTLGRESHLRLPLDRVGPDCVLAICATPCCHPPGLQGQAVMLAFAGRLLAATNFPGLRTFAFRLPEHEGEAEFSIMHLSYAAPRAEAQYRRGEPLGLMVHSLRLYRLSRDIARPPVFARPARSDEELALRFESIGQGCQFGQIQRQMGAEPLSLLRFVDTVTSRLVDGLIDGFAGVDRAERLELGRSPRGRPTYRWHQLDFDLFFDTMISVADAEPAIVMAAQLKRLTFLRRKFLEDLRSGEKIYVLTRSDCLTEAEALAVFCALNVHGPNTLLWTVFGDERNTGKVEELAPGFLCGELGMTDEDRFAPLAAWRQVLGTASMARIYPGHGRSKSLLF